jgi:hypothetical protein
MDDAERNQITMKKKMAEHIFRLEKVVKAYLEEHHAKGCRCDICRDAEAALLSVARAPGSDGSLGYPKYMEDQLHKPKP